MRVLYLDVGECVCVCVCVCGGAKLSSPTPVGASSVQFVVTPNPKPAE